MTLDGVGPPRSGPSRRELLRWLAYGGAGVAAGFPLLACGSGASSPAADGARRHTIGPVADRVLVVIELDGGNDGLSTLVPFDVGRYRDLRPTLAIGSNDVIDLGGAYGLHRKLSGVHRRGVAVIEGLGARQPDLSHFEMSARWWSGRPDGGRTDTGFLGRVCDAVHGDELLSGVSLGGGPSPVMVSRKAPTAGLSDLGLGSLLDPNSDLELVARRSLDRLIRPGPAGNPLTLAVAAGLGGMVELAQLVNALPEPSPGYPETEFATQLALVSRLIRSGAGIRIFHVPMAGAGFDTHEGHGDTHPRLLEMFDAALQSFLDEMESIGRGGDVLVATTSEFGRRVSENSGGLDHGTASCALLMGPVVPGRHGEPPSLRDLDDGNLIATAEFDRYQATLASWLGADPAEVFERDPGVFDDIIVD